MKMNKKHVIQATIITVAIIAFIVVASFWPIIMGILFVLLCCVGLWAVIYKAITDISKDNSKKGGTKQ